MKTNPYLSFNGNCAEAFRFYEKVLGGKISALMTWADTPMAKEVPAETRSQIVHARMQVDDTVLMGGDAPPGRYEAPKGITVTITVEQPAEADRIFAALSEGGTVTMPIQETFWAQRFGMFTDRYGTPWMINCEKPMGAQAAA
jgi:PhnB protein